MSGSIYGTRVTVVQNSDGAGVEINSGLPCAIHSVQLATATGGSAETITFSQTTAAGGSISTLVGAMSAQAAGGADNWYPEALFDRGFRVVEAPASGSYVTIVWRPGV